MKHKFLILPIILSIVLFGILFVSATTWNSTLNNGLVSYFKLDSNSSGFTNDSVNANSGIIENGIEQASGILGNSYNFTQSRRLSLNISGSTDFNKLFNLLPNNAFTLSIWVYKNTGTQIGGFVTKGRGGVTNGAVTFGLDNTVGDGQKIMFQVTSNLATSDYARILTNSDVFTVNNQWYHIVYVNNGSGGAGSINIYVNGTKMDTTLTQGGSLNNNFSSGNYPVTLGVSLSPQFASNYLQGRIDEISFWNRSLSDSEIQQLYNNGNGITYVSTPTIQFVSPTDTTTESYQRQNIRVNVTATNSDNITINFYNSTGLVASFINSTSPFFKNYSTGVDGIFYFNATACGSICISTETRFVHLDTFNPIVDIIYPSDIAYGGNYTYNYFPNTVNFTVLNTGSINTCLVSVNHGANITVPNCSEGNLMTYSGFNSTEGNNTITVWANDTVSLSGSHTHNYIVDTIPPTYVNIISPINATYSFSPVMLNISTDGNIITYSLNNGTNQTYSGITFIMLDEGINKLQVWSNDLAGNLNSTISYFTLNTPIPSPSYTTNAVYQVMNSSGAGLGIFIQFLGQALPFLLLGLAFVTIIVVIALSLKNALVKAGSP